MNWDQITTKTTLIEEIKRSVKKVDKERILNSILDFTIRLREMEETIFIKWNLVFSAEFKALHFDKKTDFFHRKIGEKY